MNTSNYKKRIEELLEDLPNAWCDECQHPMCIGNKEAATQQLLSLLEEVERESYKKGYAQGGVDEILRNEKARNELTKEGE